MGAQELGETTTEQRGVARSPWLWVFVVLVVTHLLLLFALPAAAGLLAGLRPAYLLVPLALHAPLSELVQHFLLPNRSGDPWDAVADLSGVVVGVTLAVVGGTRLRW
jgi:hypothetical protein